MTSLKVCPYSLRHSAVQQSTLTFCANAYLPVKRNLLSSYWSRWMNTCAHLVLHLAPCPLMSRHVSIFQGISSSDEFHLCLVWMQHENTPQNKWKKRYLLYSTCIPHNLEVGSLHACLSQGYISARFTAQRLCILWPKQENALLSLLPFFPAGDNGSNGTILKPDRGGILHAGESRSACKSISLSIKSVFYKFHSTSY